VNKEGNSIAPVEKASTTHVPSPRQQINIHINILDAFSGLVISIKLSNIVKITTKDNAPIQAVFNEIFFRMEDAKKLEISHAATFTSLLK